MQRGSARNRYHVCHKGSCLAFTVGPVRANLAVSCCILLSIRLFSTASLVSLHHLGLYEYLSQTTCSKERFDRAIHFSPLGHSSDSWGTLHAGCDDPAGRCSRQTSAAIFTMKAEPQKDSEQDGTGMQRPDQGKHLQVFLLK